MKRIFAVLLTLTVCLFAAAGISVSAATHNIEGVKFSLSGDYTILTDENLTASSKVEGLIFAAISKDEQHQIQCRRAETEFSTQLGSFAGLAGEDLAPVGQKLFPNGYDTAEIGRLVYLKSTSVADGKYNIIYVTVSDKKLYTVTYFGTDPSKIGEFIGTVTLPDTAVTGGPGIIIIIVLSICILGVVAVVVLLILSFVKDWRRRKMEQSENIVSNYIKIKRRRY